MDPSIAELLSNLYIPRVLAGVLSATLIFFLATSAILLYHWKRYESVNSKTIFAAIVYFGVSIILFVGAAYCLFLFIK